MSTREGKTRGDWEEIRERPRDPTPPHSALLARLHNAARYAWRTSLLLRASRVGALPVPHRLPATYRLAVHLRRSDLDPL